MPLTNDSDLDNDPLTITSINGTSLTGADQTISVTNGSVFVAADGTITVTPANGFSGTIDVPYAIADQDGATDNAVHRVTIGNATPAVVAEIGAAKQIVGSPTLLANGNFEVNYLVSVENTGNVDLANLTLTEDLAGQFDDAFINAHSLAIVTDPTDPGSTVYLDSVNFNGNTVTQILDTTMNSTLAVGDSFIFEFTVEINATQAMGVLENTVVATGDAIDSFGNPILDGFSNPIVVADNSDSGSDPGSNNSGEPGDTGTPDDPTPLYIPSIGLSKDVSQIATNGENFDVTFTLVWENTGNTLLDHITLFDDVAGQFGSNFVGIVPGSLSIQNFVGSGSPPNANTAWEGNTTQDLFVEVGPLHVGDSFEIVYTVTVDPDAIGSSGMLENQAIASGEANDENNNHILDSNGDLIVVFDDSDNGTDPTSENGSEDTADGIFANDPTPVYIADLDVAKSVVGQPELTDQGYHLVTFQVTVANNGNVDLASLSLVEDIASQFGPAFIDAGALTLDSGPSNVLSSISINSGFNGGSSNDFLDGSATNRLQVGDSFTVSFDVEIDSRQVTGTLVNQVTGIANAVDANGNPITDSNGNTITASDFSDSGTNTGSTNPGQPGDTGTPDDPTPLDLPEIPTGAISGTVFNDTNNDGVQQAGEAGIAGVLITLTGTDVYGDPVSATVFTDANGNYSFDGLNAGEYTVTQTQPDGFTDGIDIGDASFTVNNDQFANISLGFGDSFTDNTFAELGGSATGDTTPGFPPNLPSFATFNNLSLSNLLSGFTGGPGPIYSGIPINANANPLSLESGQAIAGGYDVNNAIINPGSPTEVQGDCCEPVIDTCDPCNSAVPVQQPVQQIITGECGCGPVIVPTQPLHMEGMVEEGQLLEAPVQPEQIGVPTVESFGAPVGLGEPSFLKRFANWFSSSDNV